MMTQHFVIYTLDIAKLKNSINEVMKRFYGLIEASYIQADDSYNEAKKNYLEIYKDYKKIKNIK